MLLPQLGSDSMMTVTKIEGGEPVDVPDDVSGKRKPGKRRKLRGGVGVVDKKWFVDRLRDRSMTQASLGRALDITRSGMARLMSGPRSEDNPAGRSATPEEVSIMARELGTTVAEIYQRLGIQAASAAQVKLVGTVQNDGSILRNRRKQVPAFLDIPTTLLAVMDEEGSLTQNMIWYFEERDDFSEEMLGRLCILTDQRGAEWLGVPMGSDGDKSVYTVFLVNREVLNDVVLETASPVWGSRYIGPAHP